MVASGGHPNTHWEGDRETNMGGHGEMHRWEGGRKRTGGAEKGTGEGKGVEKRTGGDGETHIFYAKV